MAAPPEPALRSNVWCHIRYHTSVTKTTVYLPEELKRSLAQLAAASGRPEAELIREAVAALVSSAKKQRPRGELFAGDDPSLSMNVDEALSGFGTR